MARRPGLCSRCSRTLSALLESRNVPVAYGHQLVASIVEAVAIGVDKRDHARVREHRVC